MFAGAAAGLLVCQAVCGQDLPPPPAPTAADQVERLRAENEALKRQIQTLERELAAAKSEITSLRTRSREPSRPAATRAEVPEDPLSCPDALLADLKKQYQAEFGSLQDPKDDASLRLKAQRWAREVERTARGKTTWLVRVQRIDQIGQGANAIARVTAQILEPASRLPMGEPFPLDLSQRHGGRVVAAGVDSLWQIALTVAPRVRFNPQRPQAGKPDVPPFIGRYIELEADYIVESVAEAKN
jgi:hypothetical protein